MKNTISKLFGYLQPWRAYIPITKKEYFLHLLLIFDAGLLLFKNSYDSFLPRYASAGIFAFDILVVSFWAIRFFFRVRSKEDKIKYIQNSWYYIPGLLPFPTLRFFLLLSTVKLIFITYKFIKRGEKDSTKFRDRELNFTFIELFVDTISDAIFLRSLERVEEVVIGMDFTKLNSDIAENHKSEITDLIKKAIESKPVFKRLNDVPFLSGITSDLSREISDSILETAKNPLLGEIMKELNLQLISVMNERVRKLDLDRITTLEDKGS